MNDDLTYELKEKFKCSNFIADLLSARGLNEKRQIQIEEVAGNCVDSKKFHVYFQLIDLQIYTAT